MLAEGELLMSSPTPPILIHFKNHAFSKESVCAYLYNPCDSPLHKHCDFYEFIFVTYGTFRNNYNGVERDCPQGTLLFFKKGEQHDIRAIQKDSIHFTFIMQEDYFKSIFIQYFPNLSIESLGKHRQIRLSDRQSEYLAELAKKISNNSVRGYADSFVHLFLFTVLSFCIINEVDNVPSSPQNTSRYIDDLLIRLNNFTYINHSVNQIYKDYPIAQSALITLFKKRTGMTIIQYHNMKKMEYAAQLLSSHEYTVTDVCVMLNFSSLPHFGQLFKAQFGVSPKKYQKTHFGTPIPQDPNDIV